MTLQIPEKSFKEETSNCEDKAIRRPPPLEASHRPWKTLTKFGSCCNQLLVFWLICINLLWKLTPQKIILGQNPKWGGFLGQHAKCGGMAGVKKTTNKFNLGVINQWGEWVG